MLIKSLIIDITGVLYESGFNTQIKGSIEAIEKLQKSYLNFVFLTNETEKARNLLVQKLNKIGFNISENQIISPGLICKNYLEKHNLRPHLLISKDFYSEFDTISKEFPNCVVVGDAGNEFNYDNLNKAFKILMSDESSKLISLGKGKFYQNFGNLCLDVGSYTAGLEYSTNKKPIIIGKPSEDYFKTALKTCNMNCETTLMIGDDIESDINAAQKIGIRGVLVRSGKYRSKRDEPHKSIKPFLIVNNLKELVDKILNEKFF